MRDIAKQLQDWRTAGRHFALATVVGVAGSAPRRPGATLAVASGGEEVVGAVSGGCVEGAVYELCHEAMRSGQPALERFAMDPDDAFAVGLPCGGDIEVFIQPIPAPDEALDTVIAAITKGSRAALARVIAGPAHLLGTAVAVTESGWLGGAALSTQLRDSIVAAARALSDAGQTEALELGLDGRPCDPDGAGTVRVFIESFTPPPRMLVFGAVDFAAAVARIGTFLGYRVTVCDARPVFTTTRRFPEADEVVADWPHRYLDREAAAGRLDARTVVCVLTHDAKFDVPLLERALRMPLAFVGALGSRATQRERAQRLRTAGLTEAELARLRAPIGLDLGADTPEETAVAVAAEIIATTRGGTGRPLSGGTGAIHRRPSDATPASAATEAAAGAVFAVR